MCKMLVSTIFGVGNFKTIHVVLYLQPHSSEDGLRLERLYVVSTENQPLWILNSIRIPREATGKASGV